MTDKDYVLLVDDQIDDMEYLTDYFTSNYSVVLLTKNGVDALNVLVSAKGRCILLFSDYSMPQMVGTDLIKEVNNRKINVSKIVISTSHDKDYINFDKLKAEIADSYHLEFLPKDEVVNKLIHSNKKIA